MSNSKLCILGRHVDEVHYTVFWPSEEVFTKIWGPVTVSYASAREEISQAVARVFDECDRAQMKDAVRDDRSTRAGGNTR